MPEKRQSVYHTSTSNDTQARPWPQEVGGRTGASPGGGASPRAPRGGPVCCGASGAPRTPSDEGEAQSPALPVLCAGTRCRSDEEMLRSARHDSRVHNTDESGGARGLANFPAAATGGRPAPGARRAHPSRDRASPATGPHGGLRVPAGAPPGTACTAPVELRGARGGRTQAGEAAGLSPYSAFIVQTHPPPQHPTRPDPTRREKGDRRKAKKRVGSQKQRE